MKQIVHFPTRGRRTLDLLLTNISRYYQDPIERPPFGLSDHASIELQSKERAHEKQPTITMKARDLRPTKHQSTGTYLEAVDVCTITCPLETFAAWKVLATGTEYKNRTWLYSGSSHSIPKSVFYRAPLDYIHTQRTDSSTSARPFPRGKSKVSGDKESCESRTKSQHFRLEPAVLSKIDPQQFETVPKSSTTHASISLIWGRRP